MVAQNQDSKSDAAPETKPKRTWRQRLRSMALLLIILAGLPLFALWFVVAQPVFNQADKISIPVAVDPEELEKHVRILAEDFAPRSFEHLGNITRCADYIADQLSLTGGRSSDQTFTVSGRNYRNLSIHFGPTAPHNQLGRIIIGAHYDGYGEFPAADDNASGVAALIVLAKLAGSTGTKWRHPIEFVAYPLEEPPHFGSADMGSAHHADALKTSDANVRLMISLEMLGYFSDEPGSQDYPVRLLHLYYPSRGDFLTVVGGMAQRPDTLLIKKIMRSASDLPIHSIAAPSSLPGIDFSDHRNYWEHGYPAVMISDTAFYRNKNYHTADDTPETLNYQKMALGIAATWHALLAIDAD